MGSLFELYRDYSGPKRLKVTYSTRRTIIGQLSCGSGHERAELAAKKRAPNSKPSNPEAWHPGALNAIILEASTLKP